MKIAVPISPIKVSLGGGYVFQDEILRNLKNFKKLKNDYQIIPWKQKFSDRVIRKLRRYFPNIFKFSQLKTSFEDYLYQNNFDICLYLTPVYDALEFPYIVTIWDLEHRNYPFFPEFSANGEWLFRENSFKMVLPKATAIITGTDIGKKEIESFYSIPQKNIWKIPHPTPHLEINDHVSDSIKKFSNMAFFFYPAQFWAHKNHALLIESLHELVSRGYNCHLVLTGSDQGNLSHVQALVKKLGLTDQIHFLGFVTRSELAFLYSKAQALVYTSFCGPENLPPLEAMSLKCLVLASRHEGSLEQLGDCFIGFDPKSASDLSQKMIAVLNDPNNFTKMRDEGYRRALAWTAEDFVKSVDTNISEISPFINAFSTEQL